MQNEKLGLELIKEKYNALITALVPHKMWEITIPVLARTTYAQTGLILTAGPKFDTLTDNGTTNNSKGFRDPGDIDRQLHRMMIKYNVAISGNEYYSCQLISGSAKALVQRVNDMVNFLLALDRIMKRHA